MKATRYIKSAYLYGEDEFFIYFSLELDIISEKYSTNGEAKEIIHLEDGKEKDYLQNRRVTIVKDFTPDSKNIPASEYPKNPVFVSCYDNYFAGKN